MTKKYDHRTSQGFSATTPEFKAKRQALGDRLHILFDKVVEEPIPDDMLNLVNSLRDFSASGGATDRNKKP